MTGPLQLRSLWRIDPGSIKRSHTFSHSADPLHFLPLVSLYRCWRRHFNYLHAFFGIENDERNSTQTTISQQKQKRCSVLKVSTPTGAHMGALIRLNRQRVIRPCDFWCFIWLKISKKNRNVVTESTRSKMCFRNPVNPGPLSILFCETEDRLIDCLSIAGMLRCSSDNYDSNCLDFCVLTFARKPLFLWTYPQVISKMMPILKTIVVVHNSQHWIETYRHSIGEEYPKEWIQSRLRSQGARIVRVEKIKSILRASSRGRNKNNDVRISDKHQLLWRSMDRRGIKSS